MRTPVILAIAGSGMVLALIGAVVLTDDPTTSEAPRRPAKAAHNPPGSAGRTATDRRSALDAKGPNIEAQGGTPTDNTAPPLEPDEAEALAGLPTEPLATRADLVELERDLLSRVDLIRDTSTAPGDRTTLFIEGVGQYRALLARTRKDTPERAAAEKLHARLAGAFRDASDAALNAAMNARIGVVPNPAEAPAAGAMPEVPQAP